MTGATAEAALAERVIEMAGGEAQAVVTSGRSGLTRFANSVIHQHVAEATTSVSLKVVVDGRVASGETNRTSDDALRRLVEDAHEAARLLPVDPDWPGLAAAASVGDVRHDDPATHDPDPEERAVRARAFIDAGPGMRAAGYVDSAGSSTAFANSAGQRCAGRSSAATVDGIHQTATSAGLGHQTSVALGDLEADRAGAAAARLASDGVDPSELDPGRYEVVLSPACVATIVQFLAMYGFNAKKVLEGESFVEVGERPFDPAVSVWDDVTDPRALGLPFDAEGTPKRRVTLVERGVTVGLAHDRRTARQAGTESTGHAVPGGEVWGAFPTNLFFGTGEATTDQMVGEMGRGLLVTEFNYCRILDPKTQVVTGLTRNGTFLVEGGSVVRPVRNLRFTQSFVEALGPGRVLGVESQARFMGGEFGLPAFVPTVRLAEWSFTGGARG